MALPHPHLFYESEFGMSLSVALSQNERTIHFSQGEFVVVVPDRVEKTKTKEADIDVLRVVLEHDRTSATLRGSCYREIFSFLKRKPCLQRAVQAHHGELTYDDVINNAGFGIVTMTTAEPAIGKHVRFVYYPRIDGVLRREYATSLHTCLLGIVLNDVA